MYQQDALKLIIAAALGILVGLERELKRKPLGLKTCLVICVSSCLLTIVSINAAELANQAAGTFRADPMRLAAQVVSGIGFLGAGVILRKNNEVISGLTTAAMVWASSGLGIAVGAGFYLDALLGLLLIIFSVELVPYVMRKVGPQVLREKEIEVTMVVQEEVAVADIMQRVAVLQSRVDRIHTSQRTDATRQVTLSCIVDGALDLTTLFGQLEAINGVVNISIQSQ